MAKFAAFGVAFMFLILALATGGCVSSSTVTEGDRRLEDQSRKATVVAQEKIAAVQATLTEGSEAWSMLGVGARALMDAEANLAQLQEVHGPPKVAKPYSPEASQEARELSKKEHEEGGLGNHLLAIGGAAVGIAGTIAGMPWLSKAFPALTGAIGRAAEAGTRAIAFAREHFEKKGMDQAALDLLKIAKDENKDLGVQDLVKKMADRVEKTFDLNLKVKLDPKPIDPLATVVPPPSPSATS